MNQANADDHDEPQSTWGFRAGIQMAPGYVAWELLSLGKRFEMWAAWSLERLTPVCLKIPRRDNYRDSALNALRREHTATSACDHPAIPRTFDVQLDGVLPHLVIEFIEGVPLGKFIDDNGPMDSEGVVYAGLQILAALRHIHDRGFVHHDLKPANIMVRGDRPVVVDFDLALPIGAQRSRTTPRGTHEYMSPEQIRCAPASPSMDLFALGAVMYRAATGISPFHCAKPSKSGSTLSNPAAGDASESEPPRRYLQLEGGRRPVADAAPGLAPSVAAAIEELLTVDPRRRPAMAEEAIMLLTDAWVGHGEPLWPEYVSAKLGRSSNQPSLTHGTPQTQLLTGDGVALDWCRSLSPTDRSRTVLLVDQQLEHCPPVAEVRKELSRTPSATVVLVDPSEDSLEAMHRLATRLSAENAETVVAIGGTGTLDIARLANLVSSMQDQPTPPLRNPGPSGLLMVPDNGDRGAAVVAIPTTLATGVEASPVAGFSHEGSKRLVGSPALQPAVALLDPSMTQSLPDRLVEEGLLEAMLRYVGPMLAGPSSVPTADEQALVEAAALADLLRQHRSAALSSHQRLEAAMRSANTRRGFALDGRDPFGNKLGYLAMALADLAPFSKTDAHLALLPTVIGRIVEGDTRFGDSDQLQRVGERVLAAAANTSGRRMNAAEAGAVLIDLAGPPASANISFPEPAKLAAHANRVWGDTQPMLGVFTEPELTTFYAEVGTLALPHHSSA